jgi:transposase
LYLMPPSVEEWLPGGHLAGFVVDVIGEVDLSGFVDGYRADGRGGAAYDPVLMAAVLVYAYCVGERSSRRIERRLVEDVAFRVVAANVTPDHATIARFRARHEDAIEGLFIEVLLLCRLAGLVQAGLVALDGTKMEASASMQANRDADGVERALRREVRRIMAEAAAVDAGEDAEFGDRRGDELPPELADRSQRLARLRAARAKLDAMAGGNGGGSGTDADQSSGGGAGEPSRGEGLPRPADDPGSGPARGRRRPKAKARVNLTDPDSRLLKRRGGFCQGYNAQAVVNENQIIVAAKVVDGHDVEAFSEVVELAKHNLAAVGAGCPIEAVVADAGYYSTANATHDAGVPVLIATRAGRHRQPVANGTDTDNTDDAEPEDRADADDASDADVIDPVTAAETAEIELACGRAEVLQRVINGASSINAAARELGIDWKQARDLLVRFQADGVAGIRRKRRANGEGRSPAHKATRDQRARAAMNARLADPAGQARYKKRSQIVEPVFGQIKAPRGIRRFQRRGHNACHSEWMLIAATHNLLKLWRAATTT